MSQFLLVSITPVLYPSVGVLSRAALTLHVESFVTFNEYISHHESLEPSSSEYVISKHVAQFTLSNFHNGSWSPFSSFQETVNTRNTVDVFIQSFLRQHLLDPQSSPCDALYISTLHPSTVKTWFLCPSEKWREHHSSWILPEGGGEACLLLCPSLA